MRKFYEKYIIYVLILIALALPLLIKSPYWLHLANLAGIYAILTLSLNLLTGCTGQFSVGHAGFYGIGAYASAIVTTKLGLPIWVGFIFAGILAAMFGVLIGIPTLRLKGLLLGVATMGFGEIMYQIFVNWEPVTNGTKGITGVPSPTFGPIVLNSYHKYYYLVLLFVVITTILILNLINSRVGRAFLAIRENEVAAEAMGINSTKFKVIAFTCSAFAAGIAGALYAHEVNFISPESFMAAESSTILAMVVVGGIGHLPGSLLGAIVLTLIPEYLRSFGDIRLVIYGAAIVAIIIFAPEGFGGLIDRINDLIKGTYKRKSRNETETKEV